MALTRPATAKPFGSNPEWKPTPSRRDANEPACSATSTPGVGCISGDVSRFTEPPNDAVPLVLVPTPRWTCTELTFESRSPRFAK